MVKIEDKLTLQEFLALPAEDVYYEFVDGYAVPKEPPKFFHSTLQSALLLLLHTWCKGKGRVVPEWAIIIKRQGEDWVPIPDLTYISYARLPANWKCNEACPIAPELVVEIISPGQTERQFTDKAKDYFEAGVFRVWIVNPESTSIKVFFADGSSQLYTGELPITDALLPGLELTVQGFFLEAGLI
ncbi:Uma2 family endonuclease [Aliterella atlantica]|uniref:Putative restriction endonuclease domain-containing protein n=1 Tax=Aliterella atlantica CENA595 TaxID=1618023 RepID=A0A0D8ZTT5_9CYAN|nr:hypothetical protein UH38_10320 [Aliterella atlantica CENA595]